MPRRTDETARIGGRRATTCGSRAYHQMPSGHGRLDGPQAIVFVRPSMVIVEYGGRAPAASGLRRTRDRRVETRGEMVGGQCTGHQTAQRCKRVGGSGRNGLPTQARQAALANLLVVHGGQATVVRAAGEQVIPARCILDDEPHTIGMERAAVADRVGSSGHRILQRLQQPRDRPPACGQVYARHRDRSRVCVPAVSRFRDGRGGSLISPSCSALSASGGAGQPQANPCRAVPHPA